VSLTFFAMSGITFTLPFYFQVLRGFSPLQAGLCFLPFALGQILAAPRSAGMVEKFGYRRVMTFGLVLVTLSLIGVSRMQPEWPLWIVLVVFFFFGFGMGNVMAPASTVMQNVLPLARAGAGSAVQNTVRQVGGALGIAVIGTLLANQYAKNLAPSLDSLPAQFPSEAKDAMSNSIIATVEVLQRAVGQGLPSSIADTVKSGAFTSYLDASHVTTLVSAGFALVATLLIVFALPHITPPQKGAHGPAGRPSAEGEGHAHITDAHTRAEADEAAGELEDSYAREAAEEYQPEPDKA